MKSAENEVTRTRSARDTSGQSKILRGTSPYFESLTVFEAHYRFLRFKIAFKQFGYSPTANRKIAEFIGPHFHPNHVGYFKQRLRRMHEKKKVEDIVESDAWTRMVASAPAQSDKGDAVAGVEGPQLIAGESAISLTTPALVPLGEKEPKEKRSSPFGARRKKKRKPPTPLSKEERLKRQAERKKREEEERALEADVEEPQLEQDAASSAAGTDITVDVVSINKEETSASTVNTPLPPLLDSQDATSGAPGELAAIGRPVPSPQLRHSPEPHPHSIVNPPLSPTEVSSPPVDLPDVASLSPPPSPRAPQLELEPDNVIELGVSSGMQAMEAMRPLLNFEAPEISEESMQQQQRPQPAAGLPQLAIQAIFSELPAASVAVAVIAPPFVALSSDVLHPEFVGAASSAIPAANSAAAQLAAPAPKKRNQPQRTKKRKSPAGQFSDFKLKDLGASQTAPVLPAGDFPPPSKRVARPRSPSVSPTNDSLLPEPPLAISLAPSLPSMLQSSAPGSSLWAPFPPTSTSGYHAAPVTHRAPTAPVPHLSSSLVGPSNFPAVFPPSAVTSFPPLLANNPKFPQNQHHQHQHQHEPRQPNPPVFNFFPSGVDLMTPPPHQSLAPRDHSFVGQTTPPHVSLAHINIYPNATPPTNNHAHHPPRRDTVPHGQVRPPGAHLNIGTNQHGGLTGNHQQQQLQTQPPSFPY